MICWERAYLLKPVGDVNCITVTFPCGIQGQMLSMIVMCPDLCHLSYFQRVGPLKLQCCLQAGHLQKGPTSRFAKCMHLRYVQ